MNCAFKLFMSNFTCSLFIALKLSNFGAVCYIH